MLLLRRSDSIRSRSQRPLRPEDIALLTIPNIELVTDDRIEEWMGAEQELAVDDRVQAGIVRNAIAATAVPTQAVAVFRFHGGSGLIIMGVEA